MKFHSDQNNIILDPRGAKFFVKNLPRKRWKTITDVVYDPPWYNDDDSADIEKVNQRSRLQDKKVNWNQQYTRIMNRKEREEIFGIIKDNINEDCRIWHFHSTRDRLPKLDNICCEHIWLKPINITIAGNNDRNNGEIILVEGNRLKGKLKGRILNKYIVNCPPLMHIHNGVSKIVRACSKPTMLFKELYRHFDSRHILDPFAGYGGSILSALEMEIAIDAVDSDLSLKNTWSSYQNYITLEQFF